ncbi:hypothetical protein [Lysinibacter cavernae]|nr:hypothetical protein [Lysinibacter cavernae]
MRGLVIILAAQAILMLAASVWFLFELFTEQPDSMASAIALFVLIVLGTVWVAATAVGVARSASWARGSAVTIQILQLAIAFGSFQGGEFAQPLVGWVLLISAGSALFMLIRSAKRSGEAEKAARERPADDEG